MFEIIEFAKTALESKASTSIITILAALVALIIYKMSKRDQKKDAINIILLELKNAERGLSEARKVYIAGKLENEKAIKFPDKLRLMPTVSWNKYKYLFVRDLSNQQWKEINEFYEYCTAYDEAIEIRDSAFLQNASEIRVNIQKTVAHYAMELAEKLKLNPRNDDKINKANQVLIASSIDKKSTAVSSMTSTLLESYIPDKPYNDAAYFYSLLPMSLLNTTTGERVKQLADRRIIKLRRKKDI